MKDKKISIIVKENESKILDDNLKLFFPKLNKKQLEETKKTLQEGGTIKGVGLPNDCGLNYQDVVNMPPEIQLILGGNETIKELEKMGTEINNHGGKK
jgi:hypothetical protein